MAKQQKTKLNKNNPSLFQSIVNNALFIKAYVVFCLIALFSTVTYWSILGAKINQLNSDQLVSPYLLESSNVFKNALMPGVHSFLIKWPLLYFIKLYNYSNASFIYVTLFLTIATVASLAYLLYRIERRPLIFGTLCLAVASTLLLIPIEPIAGSLLPVNMAMITTRNIEYIVFILSLILLIRHKGFKNWQYWLSVLLLSLLVASDKLFLSLSIGGALLGVVTYSFLKKWKFVMIFAHWLGLAIIAGVLGNLLLVFLNKHGVTHIVDSTASSYYDSAQGAKNIMVGVIYGILSIFTNIGANPAHSAVTIKGLSSTASNSFFSYSLISYLANILIAVLGLFVIYKLVRLSLRSRSSLKNDDVRIDNYYLLSLMLIFSTIVMFGLFIFTNHYYQVDARYLTIAFFALFVSIATYSREKHWDTKVVSVVAGLLIISLIFGILSANKDYRQNLNAFNDTSVRNASIESALKNHHVSVLVGNYWRVIPIKNTTNNKQSVMPISSCTNLSSSPTSLAWQKDLNQNSFAYLLTLHGNLTNFPNCSVKQITNYFGKPNSSLLISGSVASPNELLLFYDRGINKTSPKQTKATPGTILPIKISQLSNNNCIGPTVMNIVAHEDDDLLFINPDVSKDLQQGRCVVSVYLTAGDAGSGQFYWLSRQDGAEAAYDYMDGHLDLAWNKITVELNKGEYVQIATQKESPNISLVFLLLPDGGLKGEGFSATNFQTLPKLLSGNISSINSVDSQSSYDKEQLINALEQLMYAYHPSIIRTQSTVVGGQIKDHPDHNATSSFAASALEQYQNGQYQNLISIPLVHYLGYPVHTNPQNLHGPTLDDKVATFLQYAKKDPATCKDKQNCLFGSGAYKFYLTRQYTSPN